MSRRGATPYTVTFLEMNAPPTRSAPPQPNVGAPLMLLRTEQPPAHFYRYLYRTVGEAYQWTDMLKTPAAKLAAQLADPNNEIYVLYRGGAPAGFFHLELHTDHCCNLRHFGLTPEATGRAIGPWLLRQAIDTAWARGVSKMTVDTCTLDHPKALQLYQRAGFLAVRREERVKRD